MRNRFWILIRLPKIYDALEHRHHHHQHIHQSQNPNQSNNDQNRNLSIEQNYSQTKKSPQTKRLKRILPKCRACLNYRDLHQKMSSPENQVCLIVIDGWGISEIKQGNAIANAETPVMSGLAQNKDQYCTLDASGLSVGLPDGLMGNSEVGHLNIGAGRVIYQDIVRINLDVERKVNSISKFVTEFQISSLIHQQQGYENECKFQRSLRTSKILQWSVVVLRFD